MQVTPATRALVTGASRGIGRALCRTLAARGATLGLAARSADELERLAADLPGEHHVLRCDVADAASVRAAIERFVDRAGGLELLIANAGIARYAAFTRQPLAEAVRMTEVNWLGTVYAVHYALPALLAAPAGHIVVVSSGSALRTFPGAAVYGATKAAQRGFAEGLRHELAATRVSLTVVYPGEIATALHDQERDAMPPWYRGGPNAADPDALADRVVAAVEADERDVCYPWFVRWLRIAHGVSPALGDALLRRVRGPSAAPRRS